jgi:hypothetical protein
MIIITTTTTTSLNKIMAATTTATIVLANTYPYMMHVTSLAAVKSIHADKAIKSKYSAKNSESKRRRILTELYEMREKGRSPAQNQTVNRGDICWFYLAHDQSRYPGEGWGDAVIVLDTAKTLSAMRANDGDIAPYVAFTDTTPHSHFLVSPYDVPVIPAVNLVRTVYLNQGGEHQPQVSSATDMANF